jgi:hypothetical protein
MSSNSFAEMRKGRDPLLRMQRNEVIIGQAAPGKGSGDGKG